MKFIKSVVMCAVFVAGYILVRESGGYTLLPQMAMALLGLTLLSISPLFKVNVNK